MSIEKVVKESLKKNAFTIDELINIVLNQKESDSEPSAKKSVINYVYRNMRSHKVDVIGYDFSVFNPKIEKSIRKNKKYIPTSFPYEGIIFAWIEVSPFEIMTLLELVENGDEKARKRLKAIFKDKIRESDEMNHRKWIDMKLDVDSRHLSEEEIIILAVMLELQPKLKTSARLFNVERSEISEYIKRVKKGELAISNEFKEEYMGKILWFFKSEGPKTIFDVPFMTLNRDYIFEENKMDTVEFLNRHGFFKQEKKSLKRINNLFNDVLRLIYTSKPDKRDVLKNQFSWSLSSDKQANKMFKDLINEVYKKEYYDTLKKLEGV